MPAEYDILKRLNIAVIKIFISQNNGANNFLRIMDN